MKSGKRSNLYFLIILTIVTFTAVIYFTVDETTVTALSNFHITNIVILLLLWICIYSFDSVAFFMMVRSSGEELKLVTAYRTSALKTFSMMATPLGMGVTPALIYYLSSNKIPAGKSSSLVLTKVMINAIWILSGAMVGFALNHSAIMHNKVLFISFIFTSVLHLVFISMVVLLMLSPYYAIGFLVKFSRFLSRLRIIKKPGRIKHFLVHEAFTARKSFRQYFNEHKGTFIAAITSNGLSYFFTLTVLYFILEGLGQTVSFSEAMTFTTMLLFVIGVLPTPGGSGLAEVLFILLLSKTVDSGVLGVAVVIWRFFIYYISTGIGLSISLKHLSSFIVQKNKRS